MKLFSRIFSMLLLAFAFSVLFCAPTFAEDSLSISVDGVAEVEATPNTLETGTVDVYISSSSRDGYKLSISDSDNENALVSGQGNAINPLTESVTADNFTTNAWGVKVGDNYLPVPKLNDNVLELANTSTKATNEKHTVTFGMKVDGTVTSGAYSSEVVFTAVANPLVVRKTTLEAGTTVNAAWKTLANNSSTIYTADDNKITSIQKFTGDFTDALRSAAQDIATADSDCPVYTWFDNGTIYYYTEADEVFFNANSSYMFYNIQKLVSVDFNFGVETDVDPDGDGFIASVQDPVYITSSVTNMRNMFYGASSLTSLDVSNWNTSSVTDMNSMFYGASYLTSLDVSNWDTSKVTNMLTMFANASSLTSLNVSNWDTSKVISMNGMFNNASSLTSLDVSNWDTSSVTNTLAMFSGASSLTSLNVSNWDTSKVTDMRFMFANTSSLTSLDVSKWDTSKVTDMSGMFSGASSLTSLDVSRWNTSSVTDMNSMFYGAMKITALNVSNWDTSKVTDMSGMFYLAIALASLDVSSWDTSNVTSMRAMFDQILSLTSLDVSNWNTSNVTDMHCMFDAAYALTTLDVSNWDTSNVTDMGGMFAVTRSLTTLDLSSWDTSKVTDMSGMFSDTWSLTTIYASDKFNTSSVINSNRMFYARTSIVGGNGTVYSSSHTDKEYARIDKPGTPGYFSEKIVVRKATLKTGLQVNAIWKSLAKGDVANYRDTDQAITSIQKFTGVFTDSIQSSAMDIATGNSDCPVWSWFDSGTIYYYTEADEVFFNAGSSYMFYNMQKLVSIDFNFGLETDVDPDGDGFIASVQDPVYITSSVTSTSDMFNGASSLTSLDVSNWDTSSVTNMSAMFRGASSLTSLDVSNWNTSSATDMSFLFNGASSLTSLNASNWNTSKVTNMWSMFYGASHLTSLDVSKWNTSKVTNMSTMFYNALSLTYLDVSKWNTSKVTNMGYMFYGASSLTSLDVSRWDTRSVTDMRAIFYNASSLTSLDVSRWDTSSATNMSFLFYHTSSLTSLDVSNWDTSNVTSMSDMFPGASSLTSLDVSRWDTSGVTDMSHMFNSVSSLTSLDVSNWDTSKVTNMSGMFYNASSLTSLDVSNWDTSKVTSMNSMFTQASSLTSLDVSNWDTSKVTSMSSMFNGVSALTTIYASDKFDTSAVTDSVNMFTGASRLVGGNGTAHNASHVDKEYARIDTPTTPGYFTLKTYTVRTATLKTGPQVNTAWKTLAGDASAAYYSDNSNITSIQSFTGKFTNTIQASAVNIATDDSDYPVWSWFDNGTIYYYTESDEVFLNADCHNMFGMFGALTSIDFNFGLATDVDPDGDGIITSRKAPVYITSRVTNMESMFYYNNLAVIDLTGMDTSSVTNMNVMFSKLSSLTTIYASNLFTTNSVVGDNDVFYGTDSLVGGNGTTWGWDHTGKEYARIDKPGTPGYFTLKTN